MTCNQVIALLDVRRGFFAERHVGTIGKDLGKLRKEGLIRDEPVDSAEAFLFELTEKGEKLCQEILDTATNFKEKK